MVSFWCYVYFVLLRFRLYAFVEAAALRPIVLRYAGAPIAPRAFFFLLFIWRCRFFRVFFVLLPLSLSMESTVVPSFLPGGFSTFFISFFSTNLTYSRWTSSLLLLLLLFLTFSVLVANPKKLLYTVANPARGLLNREKRTKEKVWQHTPPPTPHTARSEKINKITRRIYRRYAGGRSRVRTRDTFGSSTRPMGVASQFYTPVCDNKVPSLVASLFSSLPSCLWSQRIFPSLPGSRLTIFYRDASSALSQLVNQWLNFVTTGWIFDIISLCENSINKKRYSRYFQQPTSNQYQWVWEKRGAY